MSACPESIWLCPVHGVVQPTHHLPPDEPPCGETTWRYVRADTIGDDVAASASQETGR